MPSVTELKQKGNECFVLKRYGEALGFYKEALALEADNVDLLNNASGAHHAMQQYDDAILCATRSLAVRENAKAHTRHGAALWSLGRLPDALRAYERAMALAPNQTSAQESVATLRRLLAPPASGAAAGAGFPPGTGVAPAADRPSGVVGAGVDLALVVAAAATMVGLFVPTLAQMAWPLLLCLVVVRSALVAYARGLVRFDRAALTACADHRCTLEALLCGAALLTGVGVQAPLTVAFGIYSFLSLAANRRALERIAPPIQSLLASLLDTAVANETAALLYATTLESIMLFTVMLSGGAIFTLVYIQYVKNIYRIDRNVQYAFTGIRMNVGRLTRQPFMPAAVDVYVQKFCDLLYTMSQGSY